MNPGALDPSACIPHIPYTDLIEQLKIYGEAPVTVSVSTETKAPEPLKPADGPAGKFGLTKGSKYVNLFSSITFCTFVDILKSVTLTPLILIGVPADTSWGKDVVTVTKLPAVAPSPEIILDIALSSVANAPTISNSGLCGANPPELTGNFWVISLVDALLNAFDNLL